MPEPSKPLIKVSDVKKSYGDKSILKGISFEVNPSEVLAIIGASGCGKSTLLRIIAGLETPDEGTVELDDPNYTLVFQYSALFDSLTVFENIAFSLMEEPDKVADKQHPRKKYSQAELHKIVAEKLRLVDLEDVEDKFPNELSGGMKKRVSLARAIVSDPKIILYDEPTSGLDPLASEVVENYINSLKKQLGAASVVVTHTLSTMMRTADKICMLDEGNIHWNGTSQELLTTEDPLVSQFIKASTYGLPLAIQ